MLNRLLLIVFWPKRMNSWTQIHSLAQRQILHMLWRNKKIHTIFSRCCGKEINSNTAVPAHSNCISSHGRWAHCLLFLQGPTVPSNGHFWTDSLMVNHIKLPPSLSLSQKITKGFQVQTGPQKKHCFSYFCDSSKHFLSSVLFTKD